MNNASLPLMQVEYQPMKIKLLTGAYKGDILNVIEEDAAGVKAKLRTGGTILLPRRSITGIAYYKELEGWCRPEAARIWDECREDLEGVIGDLSVHGGEAM